ncbi:MAG TPA: ammonium transporter [Rhizomicrobium sp.]|jgi:Amt family ammonium transporter|nr:ammonium transporter [Rhizomicrobium sp.]
MDAINAADTAWILTATALVLLMTLPALALFYGGLVQAKNVLSVLVQCTAVACICSVLWFAFGYSLAFSGDGPWLGDSAAFLLQNLTRGGAHPGTHLPESVFVMFQMTFAVITPALIIGAYVERIRFSAVLLISALWLLIVYAPVAHWVWGGGWLAKMGVMDFAGGIVVHVTAGVSALVIAWMLAPRHEFPHGIRPPHAPWMVMVGASLLWVGWFGFNAGSALSAGGDAGMAMLGTHLSAATATIVWMAIEWIKFGKPSLVGAVTGTIAGLATITPAAGVAGPLGAVLLGAASACLCYFAVWLVKKVMAVDDALDVLGVHGVGGALGTMALPLVALIGVAGGTTNHPVGEQFVVQVIGVGVVALFSAIATWVITKLADMLVGLRVDREHETVGLDFASHGETGYHTNR